MQEGLYLFCLAKADSLPDLQDIFAETQVTFSQHNHAGISAVFSLVSLDDFCGPEAETKLQDISWLWPQACRHEEVIERIMRHSPVLPARFGTIFSAVENLEKFIDRYHNQISDFLDQGADKEEWAVKGFLNKSKAREEIFSSLMAKNKEQLDSLPQGMRYFQEQRLKAEVEKGLKQWLGETCRQVKNDLCCCSPDICQRRLVSFKNGEKEGEMVLNLAFWVAKGNVSGFHDRIKQINNDYAHQGLAFEYSGPWPPYSFSPALEID